MIGLKWIFLVFLFSVGFAQKNCNRARVIFPAPVFGDGDNLSAEGCGIWDKLTNENSPWNAVIRRPRDFYGCTSTLLSPTTLLGYGCKPLVEEFVDSKGKRVWNAYLGKCSRGTEETECVKNGQGQVIKIRSVTQLNATGFPDSFFIWKMEREATPKENYVSPICLFNKGSRQDFNRTQQYTVFSDSWNAHYLLTADLSEDFGPCLGKSEDFQTCDKVDQNFLCANLLGTNYYNPYLTHNKRNRTFLRAIQVEDISERAKFFYEIIPLLDQIVALSGDIPRLNAGTATNIETEQYFEMIK